jgi:adenylate cyclase
MISLPDRVLSTWKRHKQIMHVRDPVDRLVRAVARRNSYALVWLQFGLAHLVALGGLGLLRLYQGMTWNNFWLFVGISQGLVLVDNAVSIKLTRRMWRPVWAWERGRRDEAGTREAWIALATLPITYVRQVGRWPVVYFWIPLIGFATWKLKLPWTSFFIVTLVGASVFACGVIIRYFTMEIVVRPVIEKVAEGLPSDFTIDAPSLPLRWRLLTVPVINVVTALVVSGLSAYGHHSHHAHLQDLGIAWLIAVVVSLTISLELIVLVVRTLGTSLNELQRATERVRAGDLSARVPVVATDESGRLLQSFNTMVEGLEERERLREAFGAYVDPGLAERVLREGSQFEGQEFDVTVLFLDIRDFTSFAERATPTEVVSLLNGFWELVVPVLLRHGGHANKFIGDGLLGVFGAPDPLPSHADRAVAAAMEIAALVRSRYGGQIGVGVGVNSGVVVAGTVGGGGRVEFTVIGDAVNTAARVEAATRETGDDVLITEATRERLCHDSFAFDERPPVPLKGKSVPVQLWAPQRVSLDGATPRPSPAPAPGVPAAPPPAPGLPAAPPPAPGLPAAPGA